MGNQLAVVQATEVDLLLAHLPSITYERTLGRSRFMRTFVGIHDRGDVVVKIYIKRGEANLKAYEAQLQYVINSISQANPAPCLLPYRLFFETETAGFLIRQYCHMNLADRIHTRPFLAQIEKKWIAFQLLHALKAAHEAGVCHGDIKSENIMMTTWNWCLLADFASFKPTFLLQDNPADFSFFFDTSGRRTCNIAPERFVDSDRAAAVEEEPVSTAPTTSGQGIIMDLLEQPEIDESAASNSTKTIPVRGRDNSMELPLDPLMDIFSLGCVIAEMFLDGESIFDFSQAVAYRKEEYDPVDCVSKITDTHIRELVLGMIERDPSKRRTAAQLISDAESRAFPSYFYSFLYDFFAKMTGLSADERIEMIEASLTEIYAHCGIETSDRVQSETVSDTKTEHVKSAFHQHCTALPRDPESMLEWAKACQYHVHDGGCLGDESVVTSVEEKTGSVPRVVRITAPSVPETAYAKNDRHRAPLYTVTLAPGRYTPIVAPISDDVEISDAPRALPNSDRWRLQPTPSALLLTTALHKHKGSDLAMFITLICTSLRNVRETDMKMKGLDLLLEMGTFVNDELRMQRCVPYVISLLSDDLPFVRSQALHTLTKLLSLVTTVQVTDAAVFNEYILPSMSRLPTDNEEIVRVSMGLCLGKIAVTARKLLEFSQLIQPAPRNETSDDQGTGRIAFDEDLSQLHKMVGQALVKLLNDPKSVVRRAALVDISDLCQFFGVDHVRDELLPLLITLANDQNAELRRDLYHSFIPIGSYLGAGTAISRMLPCILNGLFDGADPVVEKAASVLSCWVDLRLIPTTELQTVSESVAPLLGSPSVWIRNSAISFFGAVGRNMSIAAVQCHVVPTLRSFTKQDVEELTEVTLMESLRPPISDTVYHRVLDHIGIHGDVLFGSGKAQKRTPSGVRWYGKSSPVRERSPLSRPPSVEEAVVEEPYERTGSRVRFAGKITDSEEKPRTEPMHGRRTRAMSMKPIIVPTEERSLITAMKAYMLKRAQNIRSHAKMWEKVQDVGRSISADQIMARDPSMSVEGRTSSPIRRRIHSSDSMAGNSVRPVSRSSPPRSPIKVPEKPVKPIATMTVSELTWIPQQIHRASISHYSKLSHAVGSHSLVIPDYFSPKGHNGMAGKWEYHFESPHMTTSTKRTATFSVTEKASVEQDEDKLHVDPDTLSDGSRRIDGGQALDLDALLLFNTDHGSGTDTPWQSDVRSLVDRRMLDVVPPPPPDLGLCPPTVGDTLLPRGARILSWRPQCTLVGHLAEHEGSVNALAVAPDDLFVASASDDGTVKIWDPQHVERRGAPHARLTYSSQGGRITGLTVLENTHSVASVSSNGTVHVFRVDVDNAPPVLRGGSDQMPARLTSVKQFEDQSEGAVNCIDHYNTNSASVLVYGTQIGRIHSWDLRSKTEPWSLELEGGLGAPTCMCVPQGGNWVALGTGGGAVVLYDIRFLLPIKTLRLPATRTNRISLYHGASQPSALPWLWIAGRSVQHGVGLWDLDSQTCKQAVLVGQDPDAEQWKLRDASKSLVQSSTFGNEVRALLAHRGCPYVLTGGTDRAIRFWDLRSVNNSFVISGPTVNMAGTDGTDVRAKRRYEKLGVDNMTILREYVTEDTGLAGGRNQQSMSDPPVLHDTQAMPSNAKIAFPPVLENETPPRTIVETNETLGRSGAFDFSVHDECIMDLCVVEQPRKLLFSASRDGIVKAYR